MTTELTDMTGLTETELTEIDLDECVEIVGGISVDDFFPPLFPPCFPEKTRDL